MHKLFGLRVLVKLVLMHLDEAVSTDLRNVQLQQCCTRSKTNARHDAECRSRGINYLAASAAELMRILCLSHLGCQISCKMLEHQRLIKSAGSTMDALMTKMQGSNGGRIGTDAGPVGASLHLGHWGGFASSRLT